MTLTKKGRRGIKTLEFLAGLAIWAAVLLMAGSVEADITGMQMAIRCAAGLAVMAGMGWLVNVLERVRVRYDD